MFVSIYCDIECGGGKGGGGGGGLNLRYYKICSNNWKCRRRFVQDCRSKYLNLFQVV